MDMPSQPPATRFNEKLNFDVLFPPLPRTLIEVSRLIAVPQRDESLQALVRAIEYDPLTTATVLRRVNSAYFGLRQRVNDLDHAVRLLGFRDVCELVMTASISRIDFALTSDEQVTVFRSIMRLCIGSAFYARFIGQQLDMEGRSLTYTVALLGNLGRLVLFYNRMQDYEAMWMRDGHPWPPPEHDERLIFGIDNKALLEQAVNVWQLPPEIAEVLRHIHRPGQMASPVMRQVALAVMVAQHATCELVVPDTPPAELSTTAALHTLCRTRGFNRESLQAQLFEKQRQARHFVDEMTRD